MADGTYRRADSAERDRIARALREVLAPGYPGLALASLHGSLLSSAFYEDVDVALCFDEPAPGAPPPDLVARLQRVIAPGVELDARVLNGAPTAFRYAVLRTGRNLYCRSEADRIAFEESAILEWLDFEPLYTEATAALRAYVQNRWGQARARTSG